MADMTLAQAAAHYLSALPAETRSLAQAEVSRFIRWYGADRPLSELRGHDVSLYSDSLGATTPEVSRRLEVVRVFLAFLKKQGLTSTNLATHLRAPKAAMPQALTGTTPQKTVDLTPEGYAALEAELAALVKQRPVIAEELRRAMLDKDFRENAPLDASKEKQAHLEARIRDIEATLKDARVLEKQKRGASRVQVGSTVILRNLSSGATVRYSIVGPNEANALQGKISNASPVGRALLERQQGQEIEVTAPAGVLRFRIEEIQD